MLVKDVEISKIKIIRNSRTEKGDVSGLMKSIEQNGLQHPIGVYEKDDSYTLIYGFRRLQAVKKLGWKKIPAIIDEEDYSEEDFLTKNTVENIHRQDLIPIELGKICQEFLNKGYSKGEIAAKLHIAKNRVEQSYKMFLKVPKKYRNLIGFIPRGEGNKGKIPITVARNIISLRINTEEMNELFKVAKAKELTQRQLCYIEKMLKSGISLKQAIDNLDKYIIKIVVLTVDNEQLNELKLEGSFNKYIQRVLTGEEPLNKKLFVK